MGAACSAGCASRAPGSWPAWRWRSRRSGAGAGGRAHRAAHARGRGTLQAGASRVRAQRSSRRLLLADELVKGFRARRTPTRPIWPPRACRSRTTSSIRPPRGSAGATHSTGSRAGAGGAAAPGARAAGAGQARRGPQDARRRHRAPSRRAMPRCAAMRCSPRATRGGAQGVPQARGSGARRRCRAARSEDRRAGALVSGTRVCRQPGLAALGVALRARRCCAPAAACLHASPARQQQE